MLDELHRTLPGTSHPAAAYFARGSGHNEKAQYSERADDFENNMERLNRKFETARSFVPRPEITKGNNAKIGIIGYGTSHWGITESRDQMREEYGLETDYLRLRAYPFTREVHEFIEQHEHIYVVEQNRDAQICALDDSSSEWSCPAPFRPSLATDSGIHHLVSP